MNNPLYRERVEEQTWWELGEVIRESFGLNYSSWIYGFTVMNEGLDTFFGEAEELKTFFNRGTSENEDYSTAEMLLPYIFNRYYHHYCLQMEPINEYGNLFPLVDGVTNEARESNQFAFWVKLGQIFQFTADKYEWLLNAYKTEKENLLSKVQTLASGTTRFNDTPQDEGTFDDDEHTSHITQTSGESSSDIKPLIERLDDISSKFQNVLLDWCNEFDKLFLEGDNL